MKLFQETIGDSTVMIQTMNCDVEVLNEIQNGPKIVDTGIEDEIKKSYQNLKTVIKDIAEDVGSELRRMQKNTCPKEIDIEFSLGLSTGGVWVIAKGDCVLKVKMTWELKANA